MEGPLTGGPSRCSPQREHCERFQMSATHASGAMRHEWERVECWLPGWEPLSPQGKMGSRDTVGPGEQLCEQRLHFVSEQRREAEVDDRERCFCTFLEKMRMAPTKDEVFEKVKEALVDALGVDDDEVTPEATMVGDLGAESIDFLDIVFRLEKGFDIEIPRSELFPEDILTNAEYVQDGRVTPAGIEKLKERMPFVDLARFEENPAVQEFSNLLTVNDLAGTLRAKLAPRSKPRAMVLDRSVRGIRERPASSGRKGRDLGRRTAGQLHAGLSGHARIADY